MSTALNLHIVATLGLLFGPFLLRWRDNKRFMAYLDGFVVMAVGGTAAVHLLPEAFGSGGWTSALFAVIGLCLPSLAERFFSDIDGRKTAIILVAGILPHAALETAVLAMTSAQEASALGSAIAIHRIPMAIIVFSMVNSHYGRRAGWASIAVILAVTTIGFFSADALLQHAGLDSLAWLKALVGGALLHVVFSHQLGENNVRAAGPFALESASNLNGAHEHAGHAHSDCNHGRHEPEHHDHHDHGHHDHHDHGHNDHEHHTHGNEYGHHNHAPTPCGHEDHEHQHTGHHQHGDGACHHVGELHAAWTTFGAFSGALIIVPFLMHSGHSHSPHDSQFIDTLIGLLLESAPALLIAYVLAGLVKAIFSPAQAQWLGRGSRATQAGKGVLFGLPLPICSCGVLPVYESLVRRGVPATAAMGFLVATPELGIDAILISLPLLGVDMTIARLIAAFCVALAAGWFVGRMTNTQLNIPPDANHEDQPNLITRLRDGLRFGLIELFDHTIPWVLLGLLVAAWIDPLLADASLTHLPTYVQVPLFALLGIPVYVCASGSTPVAAVLIFQGVSPGAALAFLIAGPATNVTTFGILTRLHGRKVAMAFGLAVGLGAVASGFAVDALGVETLSGADFHHHSDGFSWSTLTLCILLILFISSLMRQGLRGAMAQISEPIHSH